MPVLVPPLSRTPYAFLAREPGPRMLTLGLATYGTRETAGAGNTPAIMAWAEYLGGGVRQVYTADSIPWCGLWMAYLAKKADKPIPASPLWALSWASWGVAVEKPELGDVLVFKRNGGGHVGLYVGEDDLFYHVFGANQGDAVCILRILKKRLHAARRYYAVGKPLNVRRVFLSASGQVSKNEA